MIRSMAPGQNMSEGCSLHNCVIIAMDVRYIKDACSEEGPLMLFAQWPRAGYGVPA